MSIGMGKKIKQTMQPQVGWAKAMKQTGSRFERIEEQRRDQAAALRARLARREGNHQDSPQNKALSPELASEGISPTRVSDENPQGENAERSRGEALPARSSERGDALTPSLSPKEQKGD